jgi:hypothetical protein
VSNIHGQVGVAGSKANEGEAVKRNLSSRGVVLLTVASWILLAANAGLFARQPWDAGAPASDSTKAGPRLPAGESDRSTEENAGGANSQVALTDFAWLDGKWQGSWGPRIAEQIWTEPRAGEVLGLFRVVENDKTLVVEMYSLLKTPEGMEFRLRHFTESLVPWEQSDAAVLKLASFDPKAAVFENSTGGQPKRITLIRIDPENYLSRSEITSASGNPQVTEIRYHKEPWAAAATPLPKKKKTDSSSPGR